MRKLRRVRDGERRDRRWRSSRLSGGGDKQWKQGAGARGYTYEGKGDYPVYPWKKSGEVIDQENHQQCKEGAAGLRHGLAGVVDDGVEYGSQAGCYLLCHGRRDGGKPDLIVKEVVREARRGKDTQINTIGLLKPQQAGGVDGYCEGDEREIQAHQRVGRVRDYPLCLACLSGG